jgi:hypothetical protein
MAAMLDPTRTRGPRATTLLVLSLAMAAAFVSGVAWAGDTRLDDANASAAKAIALLKAVPSPVAELDAHRKKAIDLLTRAQGEILKAKGE